MKFKAAVGRHPLISTILALAVVLFVILPLIAVVLYGLSSGSGQVSY